MITNKTNNLALELLCRQSDITITIFDKHGSNILLATISTRYFRTKSSVLNLVENFVELEYYTAEINAPMCAKVILEVNKKRVEQNNNPLIF